MSIFKESFPAVIKEQLLKRGETFARRNTTDLAYLSGRKAWLRMSSSVDVKEDGGALAKNYVLVGGALYDGKLRSGVGAKADNAYSLQTPSGKTHLYGIKPMPGITSVDIKSKGAYGSLREVTVNFNCWDITQLEDLELLYMRPGYSVLIEWGWIPYLNNSGGLVSSPAMFDIFNSNLKGKDYQNVFKQLFKMEEEAHGNYGGFLGIIKNYSWKARPDGGYDCSTTLISIGELVESLKMNYTATGLSMATLQTVGYLGMKNPYYDLDKDDLEKFYSKNFLSGLFYELWQTIEHDNDASSAIVEDKFGIKYDIFQKDIELLDFDKEETKFDTDVQKFITLESLCRLINKHVTIGIVDENGNKPIIGVTVSDRTYPSGGDIDLLGATSPYLLCLAHPLQMSIDPSVCLVRNDVWGAFKLPENLTPTGAASTPPPQTGDPGKQVDTNIVFNGVATPCETAAKATIDAIVPHVINNDSEDEVIAIIKKYFDACEKAGVAATPAARELQRQYEFSISYEKVTIPIEGEEVKLAKGSINGIDTTKIQEGQLYDFLDYLFLESTITNNFPAIQKDFDLGIAKAKKAVVDGQVKADLKVKEIKEKQETAADDLDWMDKLKPFFVSDTNGTADAACKAGLGQIGNIYVSLRYLMKIVSDSGLEASDKTGKNNINLYDFLKKMLTDISTATGNVNNLDIHVDPVDNIARIIDINYVDTQSRKKAYEDTFTFYSEDGKPTGKYNGLKSTVRNYTLESQIFSEQSSIVAIGAQTGGGQLGLENDTMVGFNQGVKDRLKPKMNAMHITNDQDTDAVKLENLATNLIPIYYFIHWMTGGGSSEGNLEKNKIGEFGSALKDVIATFRSLSKNPIKFKAIIPTKLSLEIDGISNLIIGNMFNIHSDLLPRGYKTDTDTGVGRKLGYVLTGIAHTVNDNGWTTKLDGQTIILEDPEGEEKNLFDVFKDAAGKIKEIVAKITTDNTGSLKSNTNYTDGSGKWRGKVNNASNAPLVKEGDAVTTQNFSKYYPKYKLVKGASDINLSKKSLKPLTESEIVDDTVKNRFNIGTIATTPTVFAVHHTGGRGDADLVYSVFYDRGFPAQYVITRDGKIHRFLPDGAKGWHAGNYNAASIGVEVVAKNDADVLPAQVQSAARLIHYLGFKKSQVFGHGELAPGHKEATEGKTITDYVRNL